MRTSVRLTMIGLSMFIACSTEEPGPRDPPGLDPAIESELSAWLEEHSRPPEEYVIELFTDHSVVFLGEFHRVRHDLLLVQSLIEPLYAAGVRVLATEFGRREDQELIDSLLAAPEWNDELAQEIVFRQMVSWGYREYVDIYRAAWNLNRTLPERAPRFRILGLNDSPDWSLIRSDADRSNPEIMQKVWRGGGEGHWADVILSAVRTGEKVLVHCGIHHAFTRYRQPIVIDGSFSHFDTSLRCGNHVYAELGGDAVTVFLHAPWSRPEGYGSPLRQPADGVIDALMLAIGPRPVGFDVAGSPFGELEIEDAVYRHGYEDFRLAVFCDGWIYTLPISQTEGVTPISEWVNAGNLERARAQSPNPRFRQASVEEFNAGVERSAEIRRRWSHLK